ncbi:MAG: DUF116 domain-containing protein [Kiritimatiellaeota bacterium]|nr:DUF116 domain-containing protein [Kiritimatiellota bacterium]
MKKMENEIQTEKLKEFINEKGLVPPLSFSELKRHANEIRSKTNPPVDAALAAILLNNALWSDIVASVPYERRILMLPQCLRNSASCEAEMDGIGLVCERCGACPIGGLQNLAESLGYVVLVAEGTSVVTKLIESGKIDAVVGVSCVNALERAFPHMAAGAVPGIAIPLDNDGCNGTTVDVPSVVSAIRLRSTDSVSSTIDIDELSRLVSEWFTPNVLTSILGINPTDPETTESLALDWLSKAGKRWRPFFTTAVYSALTGTSGEFPEELLKTAVAVECFHKASLIHDDIEDGDDFRYGESTLHSLRGVPVALNVGDYLIGLGYELIANSGCPPTKTLSMLSLAAACHKKLCLGQGAELSDRKNHGQPLSVRRTLAVFRGKTSPAFETALALGAICADADAVLLSTLRSYSDALGVAYQIKDDIEDFVSKPETEEAEGTPSRHSSVVCAVAWELASMDSERRTILEYLDFGGDRGRIFAGETREKTLQLLEHHRHEAIRSIDPLRNAALKSLLRRIITKATSIPTACSH